MTPIEASEILAYASASYPYIQLSKETVAVYVDLLGDLDYSTTKRAIRRLVAMSERFPSPATIRREVASLNGNLPPLPTDAFQQVLRQIERRGSHDGLEPWLHPAVEETVKGMGGLYQLAMSTNFDLLRAHFLKTYDKTVEKHERQTLLSRGAGRLSIDEARQTTPALESAKEVTKADETDSASQDQSTASDEPSEKADRDEVARTLRSASRRLSDDSRSPSSPTAPVAGRRRE